MRTRRRTIIERRARARRMRRIRQLLPGLLILAGLAVWAAPAGRTWTKQAAQAVFAGMEAAQKDVLLPEMTVYALQLGVYDSGESAEKARLSLLRDGLPCIIWQREKMRLVCAASDSREGLENVHPAGHEGYVIREEFPEAAIRMTAGKTDLEPAERFLNLPDEVFRRLVHPDEPLGTILQAVRQQAETEARAHPENALYTQLAQSLVNWCALMEHSTGSTQDIRSYAAVTMATLCRELRRTLLMQQE